MCHLTARGNYVPRRMRAFSYAGFSDYQILACAFSARCLLQPAPLRMDNHHIFHANDCSASSTCPAQASVETHPVHDSTAGIDGCAPHVQAARASTYYVAPSGPPAMPVYAAAAPQYTLPVSKAPRSAEDALADVKVRKTPIANDGVKALGCSRGNKFSA